MKKKKFALARNALAFVCAAMLLLAGCQGDHSLTTGAISSRMALVPIDMSGPPGEIIPGPLQLSAAKNEWTSFVLRIDRLGQADHREQLFLRLGSLRSSAGQTIATASFSAYQILPLPVDTDQAGYVRQTGLSPGIRQMPRALLPLPMDAAQVNLATLRDTADGQSPLLWIDLHVPLTAPAADYQTTCDIIATGHKSAICQLPLALHVYDFALPQQRNLRLVSRLDWSSLQRLYPDAFEAITPRLLNRGNPTYAAAIKILDRLMALAQENRTCLVVPKLQPTVKWPPAQSPRVDWSDFDPVVSPWLDGGAFADHVGLGYWPLPRVDHLDNYDAKSQRDYWSDAASHFNRLDWLVRCSVFLPQSTPGRAGALESVQLSMQGRQILDAHPLIRLALPLEDDQLQFATSDNPALLDPASISRIISAAPGLVFTAPAQPWPPDLTRPDHWLGANTSALVPYLGAGASRQDVRLWAWLAFLQHADLVLWADALPRQDNPTQQADPADLVWFYPGSWFGVDQPLPSIQLKWLRRAEQDYEYLQLASQRGMNTNALLLARLLTKQVQLQPTQVADPEYGLLAGTVDEKTWDQARELLARFILVHPPGKPADPAIQAAEAKLDLDALRWQQPLERPYVLPRTAQWQWDDPARSNGDPWAALHLGVDIYNAADNRPQDNSLQWTAAGQGWEFNPRPFILGALPTYCIRQVSLDARVDLDKITAETRKPITFSFVDGYTRDAYPTQAVLPVATSDRREGHLTIDGKLDDWPQEYLIQDGPLTKMLDRPSIQHWEIVPAATPSQIYSGWSDDNLYIAFRVHGQGGTSLPRNFIDYQFRRAWGEDLCEILLQPINDDNTLGPLTYIVCKPNGVCAAATRLDPKTHADPWRQSTGGPVRYAADPTPSAWTGELAIPWKLLLADTPARPRLWRFNFVQHVQSTGQSASWAGPIDYGRDDSFMGLLYVRDSAELGMGR